MQNFHQKSKPTVIGEGNVMAVDLSVELMGIHFKNPFLMASAPAAEPKRFKRAAEAGWAGGIIWAGSVIGEGRAVPRGYLSRETSHVGSPSATFAFQNVCAIPGIKALRLPPPRLEAAIKEAREGGIPVGVNVLGTAEVQGWAEMAAASERFGADFLELNLSCPYIPGLGLNVGREPEQVQRIVSAVKDASGLPVMAKLSACLLPDPLRSVAQAAQAAGADAISLTNTILGIAGVDIETGIPLSAYIDGEGRPRGMITGISGPAIRPLALRAVVEAAQSVLIPICGIGGIGTWQDALEFIYLGASTVQVGTALMLYGYEIVGEMIEGLRGFLERKGFQGVPELVGRTTREHMVVGYSPAPSVQPFRVALDPERCTGCGLCVRACEANALGAIRLEKGLARVDEDVCVRCYVCRLVCPVEAIAVERRIL